MELQRLVELAQTDTTMYLVADCVSYVEHQRATTHGLTYIYSVSQKSSPPPKTFCGIFSLGEPV